MRAKTVAAALLCVASLTACGGDKKQPDNDFSSPPAPVLGSQGQSENAAGDLGFPGFATKNTTRVGGADPVANAAAVARAVYPGAAEDSRPGVVTIVDA